MHLNNTNSNFLFKKYFLCRLARGPASQPLGEVGYKNQLANSIQNEPSAGQAYAGRISSIATL